MPLRPILPSFVLAGTVFLGGAQAAPPAAAAADRLARIQAAAQATQSRCYALIHHDTDEFAECVAQRLADRRMKPEERLGTQYFGWVGAVNSLRMGMPGAEEAARRFLGPLRSTQRRLRISDEALCSTIPGDCVARNARMLQMEREAASRR